MGETAPQQRRRTLADISSLARAANSLAGNGEWTLVADLNLIDFEALALHDPEMVWDLPAGMPGRLIRGGASTVSAVAAH